MVEASDTTAPWHVSPWPNSREARTLKSSEAKAPRRVCSGLSGPTGTRTCSTMEPPLDPDRPKPSTHSMPREQTESTRPTSADHNGGSSSSSPKTSPAASPACSQLPHCVRPSKRCGCTPNPQPSADGPFGPERPGQKVPCLRLRGQSGRGIAAANARSEAWTCQTSINNLDGFASEALRLPTCCELCIT